MLNNNDYPFKPRGIVKWHAFAAVISGDEQMQQSNPDKIIEIDILDDQRDIINSYLMNSLHNKIDINIVYLRNNKLQNKLGYLIEYLEFEKEIVLNDNSRIHLDEIINIEE